MDRNILKQAADRLEQKNTIISKFAEDNENLKKENQRLSNIIAKHEREKLASEIVDMLSIGTIMSDDEKNVKIAGFVEGSDDLVKMKEWVSTNVKKVANYGELVGNSNTVTPVSPEDAFKNSFINKANQ